MHSSGRTDTGIKRNNNQDSIFFSDAPVGPLPNLYIVADGMGGHRAGDKASRMAIDITVDFVEKSTIENPVALLKRAMLFVNNEIYKAACADPDLNGIKGRNHPEKNIITKAMGSRDVMMTDFFEIEIQTEEKYLLCSDGLSNMVEDDEIRDIVSEEDDLDRIAQELVDRANYYGGSDNISVIIISAD